jgi:hypothetical protein
MKKLTILFSNLLLSVTLSAQVGINTNTPDNSAALDIVSLDKGLLIPRMTTAQKMAITNPETGLLVYDSNLKEIYQNAGTSTTPVWVALGKQITNTKFFYMPSVTIDVTTIGTGKTLDLYNEYKKQFSGAVPSQFAKSLGAPATIPYFPVSSDLDYYITYYDSNVLENVSISNSGIMTYDIKATSRYKSFMNVVFVVK